MTAARPIIEAARRPDLRGRRRRPRTPTSCSTPAPRRPGSTRHRLRRARGDRRGDELVRRQAGAGRPRRRLPQPAAEARLLAGRPRLAAAAAALGLTAAGVEAAVRAARRMPALDALVAEEIAFEDAAARAAAHPGARARSGLAPVIRYPSPDRAGEATPCTPSRCATAIMIAHSLPDPFFGPAQDMHGATFVVDVAFFRETLTAQNVVVDIGAALDVLSKTLKPLGLPEPRRAAAVRGQAHHHRVPLPPHLRRHGQGRQGGRAGRGRQGARQASA